ncbi:hypothetical protein MOQ72_29625 [Saccharopolyspora sp. K220]|uniref:hypothetical protein n=1 Tax=Saccharopolyspora soli TaxID=2926618 RepID=UPI001F569A75|nr:hypothetical protein [Saccharopolyspora soli]MCI2421601.1 hypothetical protein [Saccharopolyspora soli]
MLNMLPEIGTISAILALYLIVTWKPHRPQHAGAGEGALTVWQLIAHVEAERQRRERVGRHRRREPAEHSTSDTPRR